MKRLCAALAAILVSATVAVADDTAPEILDGTLPAYRKRQMSSLLDKDGNVAEITANGAIRIRGSISQFTDEMSTATAACSGAFCCTAALDVRDALLVGFQVLDGATTAGTAHDLRLEVSYDGTSWSPTAYVVDNGLGFKDEIPTAFRWARVCVYGAQASTTVDVAVQAK